MTELGRPTSPPIQRARREAVDRSKGWVGAKVAKLARDIDYQWALATFNDEVDTALVRGEVEQFIVGTRSPGRYGLRAGRKS